MTARPILTVALLWSLCLLPARADELNIESTTPLIDLKPSTQTLGPKNLQLNLQIDQALPKPDGSSSPLSATLSMTDGEWQSGTAKTPRYNGATHTVDPSGLKVTETTISGSIVVTVKPDRWVPEDGSTGTLKIQLDGKLGPLNPEDLPDEKIPSRFWLIKPKSQSASMSLSGKATGTMDGRSIAGQATGTFQLPVRTGKWNMGTWEDGLSLHFEMGDKRVNWNYVRLAVYEFAKTQDLSGADGIRVALRTDKPRQDVSVTLWLQEQDGSWYYVRSALPLVDKQNAAVLLFEDFNEAEWVAPGSHMDADYVLDISEIQKMAIGVVNPFGVGEVDFTVTSIETVRLSKTAEPPAETVVTGKTLAVNDHNMVPPGLFGGYAPDLPQKFRPGTQRYLYAPSYPRIPEQLRVKVSDADIEDHKHILTLLQKEDAIGKHLQSLLGEKSLRNLTRRGRDWANNNKTPRDLKDILNELLRSRKLYDASLMKQSVPADLAEKIPAAYARQGDTPTMSVNRKLLGLLFGDALAPAGRHGPTEAYYIECYGERKQPAQVLWGPNWKQDLANWGKTYATNAKKNDYIAHFEFWNEPYLNWAERSRVNYNLKFYDVSKAKEGGPVHTKYGLKIPHLSWRKKGDKWQVYDPTAFSYWSGRGNSWIYDQMLAAIGKGVKETYPAVRVIGGWGFRYNEDHWAAWDMLYKPTIDRNIEVIDGIHEHHYQGDTTALNGTYEVLIAYSKTKYDRWLHSYNTETNDLVDAPARGAVDTPEKARRSREYRRMTYNLRDCLYCCYATPDKTASRTVIHNDHTPQATEIAYGLMK
ncbi:MAG: hypothetical protein ACOCZE_12715, partial [Planctomycetota bacterium]